MPAVSTLCLKKNKVLLKNQKNLIVLPCKIKVLKYAPDEFQQ
jgi:hypothetical protein